MDTDFGGYMQNLEREELRAARERAMIEQHQIWRETTWGGWVVRQLQATAKHFKPFVMKVYGMMNDQESIGARIFVFFMQILIIATFIAIMYTFCRAISFLIGKDIIKEEEILVVHEFETEEEAARARRAAARGKRSKQTRKED